MRVVFLDIDGVLNDKTWVYGETSIREREQNDYPSAAWEAGHLDPEKVALLNRILQETGAKVVVSSSWRLGHTPEALQAVLEVKGFEGEIIDFTSSGPTEVLPNGSGVYPERGQRIQAWVENFPVDSYVILEDDVDAFMPEDRTVQTYYRENGGLTDDDAQRAIDILHEEI